MQRLNSNYDQLLSRLGFKTNSSSYSKADKLYTPNTLTFEITSTSWNQPIGLQVRATTDDIVEKLTALSSGFRHGYTPTNLAGVGIVGVGAFKNMLENYCEITSDDVPEIRVTAGLSAIIHVPLIV